MSIEEMVNELAGRIEPTDACVEEEAQSRHDRLTKPRGSLGRLEGLGVKLAGIARLCPPPAPERPCVIVAAGDHGVLAQGVSPWPNDVTAAMVGGFCAGRAAVNAIAVAVGAEVTVLDVGIAAELGPQPRLRSAKVRRGTDDLSVGPAMTREEAARAILAGAGLASELVDDGVDLLLTGDMGIANTTPAACLIAALTGREPKGVTGRGTGIDDATWALKVGVVERALDLHVPDPSDPIGVLASVGGLEHAALVGVILAGAAARVPVVLDGVSANAAALVADAIAPAATGYTIAGHRSVEPGASAALGHLRLEPFIDLEMRLGEGTGALLAVPISRIFSSFVIRSEACQHLRAAIQHSNARRLSSTFPKAGYRVLDPCDQCPVTCEVKVFYRPHGGGACRKPGRELRWASHVLLSRDRIYWT